jgi:hypothetical protein
MRRGPQGQSPVSRFLSAAFGLNGCRFLALLNWVDRKGHIADSDRSAEKVNFRSARRALSQSHCRVPKFAICKIYGQINHPSDRRLLLLDLVSFRAQGSSGYPRCMDTAILY